MKRIHLFEFEDLAWFPNWLRIRMTRFIVAMHKLLGSSDELANLVAKALKHSKKQQVIDLCSGSGGPMLDVVKIIKEKHHVENLKLTFSDLYPNTEVAQEINSQNNPNIEYLTTPVNAGNIDKSKVGVRTMVCSMHHMRPAIAKSILKDAKEAHQPICVFEISDNSYPFWLWWISIPFTFIMVFFVTLMVRPVTWQQLVFTYLIPILPLFIAWDGAVSNARTYTLKDLDVLLEGLESENYKWEKGIIKGKGRKLYLLGLPIQASE
jgi:hypothetical protein